MFVSFIDACSELEEKAFFRNSRFSVTLFESVFVAACYRDFKNKKLLKRKINIKTFEKLRNDSKFISFLKSGSSSGENIKGRMERAKEIIDFVEED